MVQCLGRSDTLRGVFAEHPHHQIFPLLLYTLEKLVVEIDFTFAVLLDDLLHLLALEERLLEQTS